MTIQKLITAPSFDINGNKLNSNYTLKLNVIEGSANYLLHRDIIRHHLSKKQGTVSTKTRSEVRGGGKKPWRQKGTGRARAGSNRSPLWKGGGVIFGPKPFTQKLKLNKKERQLALQTLIYNKKSKILIIENLENQFEQTKTKQFLQICKNWNINLNKKILLVVSNKTEALKLVTQNLKNIELISVFNLNTLSVLKAEQILFTSLSINYIKESSRD